MVRLVQPGPSARPAWAPELEQPLLAPLHTVSVQPRALPSAASSVPPTAVTFGALDGGQLGAVAVVAGGETVTGIPAWS